MTRKPPTTPPIVTPLSGESHVVSMFSDTVGTERAMMRNGLACKDDRLTSGDDYRCAVGSSGHIGGRDSEGVECGGL